MAKAQTKSISDEKPSRPSFAKAKRVDSTRGTGGAQPRGMGKQQTKPTPDEKLSLPARGKTNRAKSTRNADRAQSSDTEKQQTKPNPDEMHVCPKRRNPQRRAIPTSDEMLPSATRKPPTRTAPGTLTKKVEPSLTATGEELQAPAQTTGTGQDASAPPHLQIEFPMRDGRVLKANAVGREALVTLVVLLLIELIGFEMR